MTTYSYADDFSFLDLKFEMPQLDSDTYNTGEDIEPEVITIDNLYLCKWCGVKVILDEPVTESTDNYE